MSRSLLPLLLLASACGYDVVHTIDVHPAPVVDDAEPTSRDKLVWPFAADSMWNMPIGADAQRVPAGIATPDTIGIERSYFVVTSPRDSLREVRQPGPRPDAPCSGTEVSDALPFPDDFVLSAEANASVANPTSLLLPDGQTLRELSALARCEKGGPVFANPSTTEDIYGAGTHGAQGGSGLSALGGSLREGELTGRTRIHHALKLMVWGNANLFFDPADAASCYRWPADRCDEKAGDTGTTGYHGQEPELVQGSLLALPPDLTADQLGVLTPPGRQLFAALQDYGAYVAGDSGFDAVFLGFEAQAVEDFRVTLGYAPGSGPEENPDWLADVLTLVSALEVVVNNEPTSIGGGGAPRRPLAPPFAN